jgi:DNA-binding CsgD family transcriptional regulator
LLLLLAFVIRAAVFPAALVASALFVLRSRRVPDLAWRARFSRLGWANVGLFTCLVALSIGWSRLAAADPRLPPALDILLELLYNAIAVAWVIGLMRWHGPASGPRSAAAPTLRPVMAAPDTPALFAARGITKREAEIIDLICQGMTNQEIADRLFISLTTVKDHNYVAFQKLGVRNRTELTRLVLAGGGPQPKSAS